jgi:hypothetical protein
MLKLKAQLGDVVEPLIYQSLKTRLDAFAAKHPCEAKRSKLASETICKAVAVQAARYFSIHKGTARWRGFIDKGRVKQITIEIARLRLQAYFTHVKHTRVHLEDITKLVRGA